MEGTTMDGSISNTGLYAAAIAIVSGAYSVLASTGGMGATGEMGVAGGMATTAGAWVMLLVGIVALIHGIVLLTPAAARLGGWSGPLMIAYAVVMLVNRAIFSMGAGSGMGSGSMGGDAGGGMGFGGMMGVSMGTAGGFGMVALAILMLASGLIMTVRSGDGM